jgi:archaellum component FlaC
MRTELEKAEMELRKSNLMVELMYVERDLIKLKKELDPSLIGRVEELQNTINELKERINNLS